MSRRQISITNTDVEKVLEMSDNASKYIERAILFYLEETKKEYVERNEFDEKFEILNQNYLQLKLQLDGIVESLFGIEEGR